MSFITMKTPILSLRLSETSFLRSDIYGTDAEPMYSIHTVGSRTTVTRTATNEMIADIRWPTLPPPNRPSSWERWDAVALQVHGKRKTAEDIWKAAKSLESSSDITLPSFPQSLKWTKAAHAFQLKRVTDSSLVAILLPAAASSPPRLTIYEALRDGKAHDPATEHYGVSIRLIDYLVVMSLLIVTDHIEWMTLKPHMPEDDRKGSLLDPPATAPTFASANQMRKIFHGEPLYPRSSKPSDDTNALHNHLSAQQRAKVVHGTPLFPSLHRRSHTVSTAPSSRSPSPEVPDQPASSATKSRWELPREPRPLTNAAAAASILSPEIPSHVLLDPSYYDPALATTATPPPTVDSHSQPAPAHASKAMSTPDRDPLVPPSPPATLQQSSDTRPMTGSPATHPPKYSAPLPPCWRPHTAPSSSSSPDFHPTIPAAHKNRTTPPSAYRNVVRPIRRKIVKASSYSTLPQLYHSHRSGREGSQHPPQVIEGRDEIARRIGHIVIFMPRQLLSQRPHVAAAGVSPPLANDIERPPPAYDSIDWHAPG